MTEELYFDNEQDCSINVKQNYCIVIQNDLGKKLKLDFNTDKLIVTGDLEKSEAAERFFEHLNNYFLQFINKQKVKDAIDNYINKMFKKNIDIVVHNKYTNECYPWINLLKELKYELGLDK